MNYETIIVGAGPAGLQLGYFLQKGGHSYCILERAPIAASFFDRYPHSGKLISINKKHTGSDAYDFNLRHDWNSLLNDEKMSFTTYSDDYYPAKDDLVRYMNDFAGKFNLNIKYNHRAINIFKEDDNSYRLEIEQAGEHVFATCKRLVVATGISVPNYPRLVEEVAPKPKHYGDYPKDFFRKPENLEAFRNKSVLLIGNGNSAYELGNLLTPFASHIAIYGKHHKKWASVSHYTGDLRSVYMPFFDTFLLKSLNAINWGSEPIGFNYDSQTSKYKIYYLCSPTCPIKHRIYSLDGFDHVIFCTGWKFDTSPFKFHLTLTARQGYPMITDTYESLDNKNLFFIGSLMHSLDYKQSSGGFIHGFRYLIQYFYNLHYKNYVDTILFPDTNIIKLVAHIINRVNKSSPMYQMYGQLCDTFYYNSQKKEFVYFNTVPHSFSKYFSKAHPNQIFFQVYLKYGETHIEQIEDLGIANENPANAQLLRPVIYVCSSYTPEKGEPYAESNVVELLETVYFPEDAFGIFLQSVSSINKLKRLIKGYM